MRSPEGKRQRGGILDGHYRTGRVYKPTLMAFPETIVGDWVRDDLPDLIWPALLLAQSGEGGLRQYCRFQQAADSAITAADLDSSVINLDGRLTSIEAVAASERDKLRPILTREISKSQILPDVVSAALGLYENLPGAWLLERTSENDDQAFEDAAGLCAKAISLLATDGHLEALLKFLPMTWSVIRKTATFSGEMVQVLAHYPSIESDFPMADSMVRSSFGARKAYEEHEDSMLTQRRTDWATSFWSTNWHMSSCVPIEKIEHEHESSENKTDPPVDETTEEREDVEDHEAEQKLAESAIALFDDFLKRSITPSLDLDLHAPEKHEVVTGLVARAARTVISALHAPHQWSSEHGSAVTRLLAETEILLAWLHLTGGDSYRKFQQYGIGKSKLMALRMAELAAKFENGAPEILTAAIDDLNKRLGGQIGSEFIEVDISANFSGTTVRQMAIDAGMKDLYDQIYQAASGIVHGEWWAIDDHAMQRCINPLHRFHKIPSFDLDYVSDARLARYWIHGLKKIAGLGLKHLGAPSAPEEVKKSQAAGESSTG